MSQESALLVYGEHMLNKLINEGNDNIYLYRREIERGAFKTWEYQYVDIKATELPPTPAGFKLFTITPIR